MLLTEMQELWSLVLENMVPFIGMATMLYTMWRKIDQKFEKIDQKFDKIDQRFEKIDQRFERIEYEMKEESKAINERLDSTINSFNTRMDSTISSFNMRMDEIMRDNNRIWRELQAQRGLQIDSNEPFSKS